MHREGVEGLPPIPVYTMELDSITLGYVRQILIAVGASLITRGWLSESLLEPLVGLGMVIVSAAWSHYNKRQVNKTADAAVTIALASPADTPPEMVKEAAQIAVKES